MDARTLAEQLKELETQMTPGPWELWDSNSWRRFGSAANGKTVIEPIPYSAKDNHPDLHFTNAADRNITKLRNLLPNIIEALQSQWIKITDDPQTLPKIQTLVWYMLDGETYHGMSYPLPDGVQWWNCELQKFDKRADYWMPRPLPAPPPES